MKNTNIVAKHWPIFATKMEMSGMGQVLVTDSDGAARHESWCIAIGYWHDEGKLSLSAKNDIVSTLSVTGCRLQNKLIILRSTNLAS